MKTKIKMDIKKGRGVYADELIIARKKIEICQLIIMKYDDVAGVLERYVFEFNKKNVAVALGNGSLYNHSDEPNAQFFFDYQKKLLIFESLQTIKKGQEITVDYRYDIEDRKRFDIK